MVARQPRLWSQAVTEAVAVPQQACEGRGRLSLAMRYPTQLDGVVHYAIRIGLADVGLAHS